MNKEVIKDFLKDLTKLSRKHKITIGGCGCCGSPYLVEIKKSGRYVIENIETSTPEKLQWINEDPNNGN